MLNSIVLIPDLFSNVIFCNITKLNFERFTMKKLFMKAIVSTALLSALGLNLVYAGQKGGVFVGVMAGLNFNTVDQELNANGASVTAQSKSKSTTGEFMYGAKLGYIAALSPKNAFRIYAEFTGGNFTVDKTHYSHMTAGGGLDFLHNFGNVFGLFFGAGYNYAFGDFIKAGANAKPWAPYINFGLSWTFKERIRIDLEGRYLFSKYHNLQSGFSFGGVNFNGHISTSTSAQVGVNLSYVF